MIDFTKPVRYDTWDNVFAYIRDNIIQSAVLFADGTGDNIPDGAVRLNKSTMKFEQWTGSPAAWTEMPIVVSGSAAFLKDNTTTGVMTITGLTAAQTRVKTLRDANDTILEAGGQYTISGASWTFNNTITGSINGNASTATTLQNTRTIWGQNFNGSANVSGLLSGPGAIELTGTYGSGADIALSGAGTRMIWNPKKAAFRVGRVSGTQWDNANVGSYSLAMGFDATASGSASTAMGYVTTASGHYSAAMGFNTIASGNYSTALGLFTKAESFASVAIGRYNIGGGTPGSWVATDPIFEVGNGTADGARSNAFTVYQNGNATLSGTLTANALSLTTALSVANGGTGLSSIPKYLIPIGKDAQSAQISAFGFNVDNGNYSYSYAFPVFDSGGRWGFISGGGYNPAPGTRGGLFLSGGYRDNNAVEPNGFMLSSEFHSHLLQKLHISASYPRPGTGLWSGLIDRITILSSGNIGINTTAPARKLEVKDDSGAQLRLTDSSGNYTDFQTDGNGNLTIAPSGGRRKASYSLRDEFTGADTSPANGITKLTEMRFSITGGSSGTTNQIMAFTIPNGSFTAAITIEYANTVAGGNTANVKWGRAVVSYSRHTDSDVVLDVLDSEYKMGTASGTRSMRDEDTISIGRTGTETSTEPQEVEITVSAGSMTGTARMLIKMEIFEIIGQSEEFLH